MKRWQLTIHLHMTVLIIPALLLAEDDIDKKATPFFERLWGKKAVVERSILAAPDSVIKAIEKASDQPFAQSELPFWTIQQADTVAGYALMDAVTIRNQSPLVLTLFDARGQVQYVRIFQFHGMYGRGATTQGWLKNFLGKTGDDDFSYADGLPAISGATESAHGIRKGVQRLSKLILWRMRISQPQNAGQ